MATSSIIPATNTAATAAINSATTSTSNSTSSLGLDQKTIAGNFNTFLQLLTTQLKNQNPLDPLDTNQFTSQLVQFAQVEQQLRSNDQLATLVSLQKTAQSTAALSFVGQTVVVDGSTAQLANGQATWNFTSPKPATATITIKDSAGQTRLYRQLYAASRPAEPSNGTAKTTTAPCGRTAHTPCRSRPRTPTVNPSRSRPRSQGVVDSADLTQNPPLLSIGGQSYTLDKIKRVVRSHAIKGRANVSFISRGAIALIRSHREAPRNAR